MSECTCHAVDNPYTHYGITEPGGAYEPNPDCPEHFPKGNPMTTLDEIEARIANCRTYNFGMYTADKLAHDDAPKLLAAIRAVEALAEKWHTEYVGKGDSYSTDERRFIRLEGRDDAAHELRTAIWEALNG